MFWLRFALSCTLSTGYVFLNGKQRFHNCTIATQISLLIIKTEYYTTVQQVVAWNLTTFYKLIYSLLEAKRLARNIDIPLQMSFGVFSGKVTSVLFVETFSVASLCIDFVLRNYYVCLLNNQENKGISLNCNSQI